MTVLVGTDSSQLLINALDVSVVLLARCRLGNYLGWLGISQLRQAAKARHDFLVGR